MQYVIDTGAAIKDTINSSLTKIKRQLDCSSGIQFNQNLLQCQGPMDEELQSFLAQNFGKEEVIIQRPSELSNEWKG